ncbi:MAG: coproporphyrinogen III oxidase family protein, partial [Chloroflexota bacterium]|nr:coproporphyrinogen III oxidase family protein [Chloroflexota bacterium]
HGRPTRGGGESIDDAGAELETVILGLRLVDGLSRTRYAARFGADPVDRHAGAVERGVASGLLAVDAVSVRLTPRGRLLANEALEAFVGAAPR